MFKSEIIMQPTRAVLLNHESRTGGWVRFAADGFGCFVEVALAFVFFETHWGNALSRKRKGDAGDKRYGRANRPVFCAVGVAAAPSSASRFELFWFDLFLHAQHFFLIHP